MQKAWVQSWVREDPAGCEQLSPRTTASGAHALEPVLCNKRGHRNEKPVQWMALDCATRDSLRRVTKTQCSQKKEKSL